MSPSSILVVATLFLSACSPANKARVDELNEQSYAYHYRNLDSTKVLAERALKLSEDYPSGRAEAYNNLAFVCIAKMDYKGAKGWLKKIEEESDNQIELAIADVQNMRLCQRESHNKDFYAYREKAMRRLRRIREEVNSMPPRESKRVIYAKSEVYIADVFCRGSFHDFISRSCDRIFGMKTLYRKVEFFQIFIQTLAVHRADELGRIYLPPELATYEAFRKRSVKMAVKFCLW